MFRSATLKLTLYYLGIVIIIGFGFSAILYHDASNELSRQLGQQYQRWNFAMRYFDYDPSTPQPTPPNPLDEVRNGQRHLFIQLIYFNFLVLVGAGGASYALARKTLGPIEAAHEQQKRFTADVSHELRTPLTALKMESEVSLLDKDASKTQLRHVLSSNLEEANKLETLINNLLRLSQLENVEAREGFTSVSLNGAIQHAIDNLDIISKKRDISVTSELKQVNVFGEGIMLTQLGTILIDNALKYSLPKTTVIVATKRVGNNAQLTITDQGIGIETSALPHIFDRFYRADKARSKSDSQGYGLGLSLAKMIAELHHGSVNIKSKPKVGTMVTIILPATP
jgi:two-component system sensor histidine kinase CiaH